MNKIFKTMYKTKGLCTSLGCWSTVMYKEFNSGKGKQTGYFGHKTHAAQW